MESIMRELKNDCMQSLDVYLRTPEGIKSVWLQPGEHLVIPVSYITDHVKTLQRRSVIQVRSI